ncbi:MAG: ribbon-helix-helix protein, CopG family [Chloroflexi bacterium]|nr:ribbon-helix-helix protein, CopG family [Chloroflexota bacterium]
MHKTTVYLPEAMERTLKEAARQTGRREADLVREAIAAYLERRGSPQPQSIGAGADDELPARDSEDWLRARWRGE